MSNPRCLECLIIQVQGFGQFYDQLSPSEYLSWVKNKVHKLSHKTNTIMPEDNPSNIPVFLAKTEFLESAFEPDEVKEITDSSMEGNEDKNLIIDNLIIENDQCDKSWI